MCNINIIVACDFRYYGIGKDNKIPWDIKSDKKFFRLITTGSGNNAVIMGRKTYDSIGKALPDRLNIVLSHNIKELPDCIVKSSLDDAIEYAKNEKVENIFIIGGESLYEEALKKDIVDMMYITRVRMLYDKKDFDTFFFFFLALTMDWIEADYLEKKYERFTYDENIENIMILYRYRTSDKRHNNVDNQYLELLNDIIENGNTKHTRAGETLSLFSKKLEFDLREGLPILTTKKVYSKGCIHELLWFLKGGTNIKYLIDNDTHIWDDDAYRYYLELAKDKKVLSKEEFLTAVKEERIRKIL